eukprot:10020636-Ditylum_brightwellii.AAC.1
MEVDEAYKQSKEKLEGSPKRKEMRNNHIRATPTLEQRKQFHPTPYQTKQTPNLIKEKDYLSTEEQIKLRGAVAIGTATEVVTPVTIEFLVPTQVK